MQRLDRNMYQLTYRTSSPFADPVSAAEEHAGQPELTLIVADSPEEAISAIREEEAPGIVEVMVIELAASGSDVLVAS